MHNLEDIIRKCKKGDKKSQKQLYEIYSPVLYGICLRYAKTEAEAQDMLQEGFIKILTKISHYTGQGSFEGWMRRIIVNTSITAYHKNKKHNQNYDITNIQEVEIKGSNHYSDDYTTEELLNVIKTLPPGYKMVFNMYAIEGYRHKEIAEKLEINENTSKSQYSRAKKLIQKKLKELSKIKI